MQIVVTGASGMLAHDLIPVLKQAGYTVVAATRTIIDITSSDSLERFFDKYKSVDLVVNCAAYTTVDDAEDIGMMQNYKVNALGVGLLAKFCNKYGVGLIHISTDYVFDGEKEEGYLPSDDCHPLNEYGKAKRLGEQLAKQHYPDTIIVRTSWLYGGGPQFKNFVNTMIRLGSEKGELSVVNDQYGLPTYTGDLALGIEKIMRNIGNYHGSILHLSNSGEDAISWCGFAQEVFDQLDMNVMVNACSSSQYKTNAKRPQHSLLTNNSDIMLQEWKIGLQYFLDNQ